MASPLPKMAKLLEAPAPCPIEEKVFGQYELLRIILSHLPMSSLRACAQVNKRFNSVAQTTYSDKERTSRPEVLTWVGRIKKKGYYAAHKVFESPEHQELYDKVSGYVAETKIRPEVVLLLATGDGNVLEPADFDEDDLDLGEEEETGRLTTAFTKDFFLNSRNLEAILPKGCELLSFMVNGAVTMPSYPEVNSVLEIENLNQLKPAVSMYAFPAGMRGVTLVPFNVGESLGDIKRSLYGDAKLVKREQFRRDLLRRVLGDKVPEGEEGKIKAVVALSDSFEIAHTQFLLQEVSKVTGGRVAIGGALGYLPRATSAAETRDLFEMGRSRMFDMSAGDANQRTSGLIIAGDGVDAASVVLGQDVRGPQKVEAGIRQLKEAGLAEENSLAFMFACCGRGKGLHLKPNAESAAFRKLFPRTPLIGVFGNGEIGVNYTGKVEENRVNGGEEVLISSDDLNHSYCTVFMLISFKS